MDAHCELIGGPYDGRTGVVAFRDEPGATLTFSLADKDRATLLVAATAETHELDAVYVRVNETPRKVVIIGEDGQARSAKGVRYRYSRESPCERALRQADRDALLTADAHDQVMATRRLLLEGKRT